MTKAELIKALEKYPDDAEVDVGVRRTQYVGGVWDKYTPITDVYGTNGVSKVHIVCEWF